MGCRGRLGGLFGGIRAMLDVRPFGAEAAETAAVFAAELDRTGRGIGRIDPQIAGIAVVEGRTLVTGNAKHFGRTRAFDPRLTLDDWRA